MCYTKSGLELAKVRVFNRQNQVYLMNHSNRVVALFNCLIQIFPQVTVVGVDGRLVYESLVCPENDIIDFNTRYSGISAKDFGKLSF